MLHPSNYLRCLCVLSLAWYAGALVYYMKMDKGAHGCKPKAGQAPSGVSELKVGEVVQDDKTCGILVCQNEEGDVLVYYCQKPAPFEMCTTDGVDTNVPFPECCWKCVAYKDCGKSKHSGDSTPDEAAEGGNTPANADTGEDTVEDSSATEPASHRKYKHKKF